ncbi:hypothetical protein E2542_SST00615 [Spatholobus suberectus]|nr:hypothetical protein E2542_SST00615 [Spatholobus suberectus]
MYKRVLRLQDDMGNTPLHEVAFTGEVEMTKSVLEHEEKPGPGHKKNVSRKKEMTEQLDLFEEMKEPYVKAKRGDWEGFGKFFREHRDLCDKQIDLHNSTPLHYAAHSSNPKMYEEMLEMVSVSDMKRVLRLQDNMGNTPLHEVVFTGEMEMTKSILEHEEKAGHGYMAIETDDTRKEQDLETGGNGRNESSPIQMKLEDNMRKGQNLKSREKDRNEPPTTQRKLSAFSWMWYTMWKVLAKGASS